MTIFNMILKKAKVIHIYCSPGLRGGDIKITPSPRTNSIGMFRLLV